MDGYYTIITSETHFSHDEVIERYRELSKIEEQFRVIKSDLEGRLEYVKLEEDIEGHFLVYYIALIIMRILEHKLGRKHSIALKKSLNKCECKHIGSEIYTLNQGDEALDEISARFGVSFHENMRYEAIKNNQKQLTIF